MPDNSLGIHTSWEGEAGDGRIGKCGRSDYLASQPLCQNISVT